MPKFRPSPLNCLYVIPDQHGAYEEAVLILKQILPLRKSDGGKDHLFLLGDLPDRNSKTHQLIDLWIQVEDRYPNQVHRLMGNHEQMMLKAFGKGPYKEKVSLSLESDFRNWVNNGGYATIQGYLERQGITHMEPWDLPRFRVETLIPKEHWDFLAKGQNYIKFGNYLFVHGGLDPWREIEDHEFEELLWDRSLYKLFRAAQEENDFDFVDWDYTIITGHNGPHPLIHPNYMMLDAGSPERLICVELNSMQGVLAKPGNSRLIKFDAQKQFGV